MRKAQAYAAITRQAGKTQHHIISRIKVMSELDIS